MNCPKYAPFKYVPFKYIPLLAAALFAFTTGRAQASVPLPPDESMVQLFDPGNNSVGSVDVATGQYMFTGSTGTNEISDSGGNAVAGDAVAVVHYQTTDFPASSFFDVFCEVSVPPSTQFGSVKVQLTNDSSQTQTISNAGYFLSPTEIPLDNLNPTNYPPSDFNPITGLDTSSQGASQVDSATVSLPEPASALTIAPATFFLTRRRRAIRG